MSANAPDLPRAGPVWPVRVDPSGRLGPTRAASRSRRWRRSSHGLYVPASVERTALQRIVEAAAVLPSFGGVTGWAALHWCGASYLDGSAAGGRREEPVTLATGYCDILPQPDLGIAVSQERLGPGELMTVGDLRITTPVRSLCFMMRYAASLREAVRFMDMAAYDDLVSIDEARAYADAHPGWTGAPQLRAALDLADENAWSPAECDLRMVWRLDAGLPPPLCNQPVFDRQGEHIGTPDLLDVEAGVVGEYDGPVHLLDERRRIDLRRQEDFRRHGLEQLTVVTGDLTDRTQLVERMLAVRARARFQAESERSWTLEPPPWWTPTLTVAQRRALGGPLRERLLARRRTAA